MITYPEQSKYVKGTKIWLDLPNDKNIIVSPQARKLLTFFKVDEQKFILQLKTMLELFGNLDGKGYSFHRISVGLETREEGEDSHLIIRIYDHYSLPIPTEQLSNKSCAEEEKL